MHIRKLSDEKILELAQKYGEQARLWRQRFVGLLPEVNRRKLYEKKACNSIVEFGAKSAGLSREQVFRALNLERKFEDKPVLKSLFESGAVSINKLVRVASIATKENEEILAEQTKILSNRALETFVKDERTAITENQNSLQEPIFRAKDVHVHTLLIAEDVENELSALQKKGIDINQLLREFLQRREQEILAEKTALHEQAVAKAQADAEKRKVAQVDVGEPAVAGAQTSTQKPSPHVSVKIKNLFKKEHGKKCSIPICNNLSVPIHHSQRLALAKYHDPFFMAPLCKEHHQIAHSIDIKYQEKRIGHG